MCNLREVFGRLKKAGLHLKLEKCHLAKCEIAYLGYKVFNQGVAADPNKVKAAKEFSIPGKVSNSNHFGVSIF